MAKHKRVRKCISFIGNDIRGFLVAGNHDVLLDSPIKGIEDIKEIQECIELQNGLASVAIINIMDYEEE